jgi:hypothetical protein
MTGALQQLDLVPKAHSRVSDFEIASLSPVASIASPPSQRPPAATIPPINTHLAAPDRAVDPGL